jgi:methionyl-tRNA formyltransferase
MKIVFLANNEISLSLYNWLKYEKNEYIVLLDDKIDIYNITQIQPDIIISYNYKYMIPKEIIQFMKGRIINLHISMLPWNRGASPNFWSFIDKTPKGVTIHLINEGLDTGDILFQKEVFFNECKESLSTSYEALHKELQCLFKQNWSDIRNWSIEPKAQINNGSVHFVKDFDRVKNHMNIDIFNVKINNLIEQYNKLR